MEKLLRQHTISFRNALAGLRWALTTQPNFRVHLALTAIALILGWYFAISPTEWAVIVFTVVLGLSAEMINTVIEEMTDLITKEWREVARLAKDVSAGMMLTVAMGAVVVAAVIFIPKILLRTGL